MAISAMRGYLDRVDALPTDCLLGFVVWFKISEAFYELPKIAQWFEELNLTDHLLPAPDSEANAFKKAITDTRERERSITYTHVTPVGASIEACLLLRELPGLTRMTQVAIVRELRTSPLRHQQVAVVKFVPASIRRGKTLRGTARVATAVDTRSPCDQIEVQRVGESVSKAFERYLDFVDDMKVRAMVRQYLGWLNGCMLRPGVYFVHASREDELRRFVELVTRLGQGCSMSTLPIPDLAGAREEIMAAFQDEATADLRVLVKDVTALRGRTKIPPSAYARLRERYTAILARAGEYSAALGLQQDRTEAAQEMAMESLFALQRQMIAESEA